MLSAIIIILVEQPRPHHIQAMIFIRDSNSTSTVYLGEEDALDIQDHNEPMTIIAMVLTGICCGILLYIVYSFCAEEKIDFWCTTGKCSREDEDVIQHDVTPHDNASSDLSGSDGNWSASSSDDNSSDGSNRVSSYFLILYNHE
jgi:hypothetical protein